MRTPASARARALVAGALLLLLPALAHAPALLEQRLLGPGDGAALHFPLRAAAWEAWGHGQLPSWNPSIFLGAPLLSSYRPGALHPLMLALTPLPPFAAFQLLVLLSLGSAGVLMSAYARRLGAERVGAFVAGLSFALGPYLVGHLGETATIVAAPGLPLVLLAAEAALERASARRLAALAAALALVLLAGSPAASRAALLLLAGRAVIVALSEGVAGTRALLGLCAGALLGALLAAPQLIPTLLAWREAGPGGAGRAAAGAGLAGFSGLLLRYASHTPAPALALAALPLALRSVRVRFLFIACALSLALQWGRGPLAAPSTLPLVFDLTLSLLAGLSLSAQWRARREAFGYRLRAHFLAASLASAAALSVAAAALGPLPETLAGAVGVLALALILYFTNAASANRVKAGVWLLPLTVSFVLQPHGRRAWDGAPTRAEVFQGTGTREALERAMGPRRSEPVLTLARAWPVQAAPDLAYGNWSALTGRINANGYDPLVPLRTREALGGMSADGTLPDVFFRSDPSRLEILGVRWVQASVADLAGPAAAAPPLRLAVAADRPRFLPFPITPAQELAVAWSLAGAERPMPGALLAWVQVRLASGRDLALPLLAQPGERPENATSWRLPGRYYVDGVRIERVPGPGRLTLGGVQLRDAAGRRLAAAPAAGYVSDGVGFREAAATPVVRLFELPAGAGTARVVSRLRVLPGDDAVLGVLAAPSEARFDPHGEAMTTRDAATNLALPAGARSSRATLARTVSGRLEVRAQGPGLLVVAVGWDPGWSARIDARAVPVFRVNHAQLGVLLADGIHRIELAHHPRGFHAGLGLALAALLALAAAARRRGRDRGRI